jgi:hypothetical protein
MRTHPAENPVPSAHYFPAIAFTGGKPKTPAAQRLARTVDKPFHLARRMETTPPPCYIERVIERAKRARSWPCSGEIGGFLQAPPAPKEQPPRKLSGKRTDWHYDIWKEARPSNR